MSALVTGLAVIATAFGIVFVAALAAVLWLAGKDWDEE